MAAQLRGRTFDMAEVHRFTDPAPRAPWAEGPGRPTLAFIGRSSEHRKGLSQLLQALPGIVLGLTLAMVSLIGYSAMVGAVGGEGLGDLGIRYGYQRFMPEVMAAVVAVLIVLVQTVQSAGDRLSRRLNKRLRHA